MVEYPCTKISQNIFHNLDATTSSQSLLSGFEACRSEFQNDLFVFLLFSLWYLLCSVLCLAHFKKVKTQPNSAHVTQASRRTKEEERQSKGHHVRTKGTRSLLSYDDVDFTLSLFLNSYQGSSQTFLTCIYRSVSRKWLKTCSGGFFLKRNFVDA